MGKNCEKHNYVREKDKSRGLMEMTSIAIKPNYECCGWNNSENRLAEFFFYFSNRKSKDSKVYLTYRSHSDITVDCDDDLLFLWWVSFRIQYVLPIVEQLYFWEIPDQYLEAILQLHLFFVFQIITRINCDTSYQDYPLFRMHKTP